MTEIVLPEGKLYLDKQSGKDFKRPGYQTLLKQLNAGDTLVIKSIDQLGRYYVEVLNQCVGYVLLGHENRSHMHGTPDLNYEPSAVLSDTIEVEIHPPATEGRNQRDETLGQPVRPRNRMVPQIL